MKYLHNIYKMSFHGRCSPQGIGERCGRKKLQNDVANLLGWAGQCYFGGALRLKNVNKRLAGSFQPSFRLFLWLKWVFMVSVFKILTGFYSAFWLSYLHGPNVSPTPITAMGCRQCLPLSVEQLKGKHCQKPHCRNGSCRYVRVVSYCCVCISFVHDLYDMKYIHNK